MDNLHIARSDKTPLIEFSEKGELRIEGRSYPENPIDFYSKPIKWIQNLVEEKPKAVNLHVALEHFNTSSSKMLLDIFKLLETLKVGGTKVNLYWYYHENNEDILEGGKDYESILKIPFHYAKIQ
jgi:hypothetical protein